MNGKLPPWPSDRGQLLGPLPTNVTYEFDLWRDERGVCRPRQLGKGKYAKVYLGWLQNDGCDVMPVAIKIPHDYSSFADERLFKQEIERNKEMCSATGVNICKMLDVLQLGAMAMCGCGKVYRPLCPSKGCGVLLRKADNPKDNHPALYCDSCGYELSAQHIADRFGDLLRYPAKPCCQDSTDGTILNFVDRQAAVLERLHGRLDDFADLRRRNLQSVSARFGIKTAVDQGAQDPGRLSGGLRRLRGRWDRDRDELLLRKVALLEKMRLMVQLADAVAWLHTEKNIVHKDLAPDNVMLCLAHSGEKRGEVQRDARERTPLPGFSDSWRGEKLGNFRDTLNDLINYPTYCARIIDFGLSDKNELTQSWYEEAVGAGNVKHPYLSPEARLRKLPINTQLEIDEQARRFKIPPELRGSLMPTDIIADMRDPEHNHDLEIIKIEPEPQTGADDTYAYFRGDPPRNLDNQQFELVRRLGEAHDIYSLASLFYYILTEQHDQVEALGALVRALEDVPFELTARALGRNSNYLKRRDAIREKFWQDEMMVLILRAMVRGQPQSLVQSRIQRGPEPAQRFLHEIKRIFHGLQQEILAAPPVSRLERRVMLPSMGLALAGLVATTVLWVRGLPPPAAPRTVSSAVTAPAEVKPPQATVAPVEATVAKSQPPEPPPPPDVQRLLRVGTEPPPAAPKPAVSTSSSSRRSSRESAAPTSSRGARESAVSSVPAQPPGRSVRELREPSPKPRTSSPAPSPPAPLPPQSGVAQKR